MQEIFEGEPELRTEFIKLLSRERFARYLLQASGNEAEAVALYCWNMRVAQSLYSYLQCWEIALRNRLNGFLCWKYNPTWPYDETRCLRNLTGDDERRLDETKQRQQRDRQINQAPTSAIVADLSAGFWVSMLFKCYDVPYTWRYNVVQVFPNDQNLDRVMAWQKCDAILRLRNRVAHHEPVFHLPLLDLYEDLRHLVGAMCPATRQFAEASCDFRAVWELRHASNTNR